jgi:hypothetical protein
MSRVSSGLRAMVSHRKLCPQRTPLLTSGDTAASLKAAGQQGTECTRQPRRSLLHARMPLQWPKAMPPLPALPAGGSSL